MKFIMGMAQAIFGLIWIGAACLFALIGVGIIVVRDALDWFKKINNECNEAIKEYYRGLEKIDNE